MVEFVFIKVLPVIVGTNVFYCDIEMDMLSWLDCCFSLILYSKIF